MRFDLESEILGSYKIGPDPDDLGMIRIYSNVDVTAVQVSYDDVPDLILALQKLQAWRNRCG